LNISRKLVMSVVAGLVLQGSVYLYLDQIVLAPTAAFEVSPAVGSQTIIEGKAYYSHDRRYMALVKTDTVEIYSMPGSKLVRTVELKGQQLSYFKWLEDRNLALMGLYIATSSEDSRIVLAQLNPMSEGQELGTMINKLPPTSKITDVAYSTATNVIYMQVQVASSPNRYRIYRTDANQDITRVYINTSNIGSIGSIYEQDSVIYDNLDEGTIIVRHGDGSWQVISPVGGRYRLVGVSSKNMIYIARLNAEGLAETILQGGLLGGFAPKQTLQPPVDIQSLQIDDIKQ